MNKASPVALSRWNLSHRRLRITILLLHTLLLCGCAVRNSFSWTETGLLTAGIINHQHGRFDIFRVNPPLIRMWATLPLAFVCPELSADPKFSNPRRRVEWTIGAATISQYGKKAFNWLIIARIMCVPISLLGAVVTCRWSSELFGQVCGTGSLGIWAFSPMMIGYGSLISGDAQAAAMGIATMYLFRSWLASRTWNRTIILGFGIGLTVLTKFSWVVLFGVIPAIWSAVELLDHIKGKRFTADLITAFLRSPLQLATSILISVFVINLAYGFEGSFTSLGEYKFISKALTDSDKWKQEGFSGNRFADTAIGSIPIPFPKEMITGIDLQKWDFDRDRSSYLRGEWRIGGWWYYYLYALLVKLPIGFLLLAVFSITGAIRWRDWRESPQEFLVLSFPAVVMMSMVSLEVGLNRHIRYALPAMPFVFVLVSRAFLALTEQRSNCRWCVCGATAFMIVSSLWIFPHSHSYFNEASGGPLNGARHLNASNLDWGQDITHLARWCHAHPSTKQRWVTSYVRVVDLEAFGIHSEGRAPRIPARKSLATSGLRPMTIEPGWYIVDNESLLRPSGEYDYLRNLPVAAYVGYAFRVFYISDEIAADINRKTIARTQ